MWALACHKAEKPGDHLEKVNIDSTRFYTKAVKNV